MELTKYSQLKHGMSVTCKIKGTQIDDAKISINPSGKVFVCQNVKDGSSADERFGYKYSWIIAEKNQDAPWYFFDCTNLCTTENPKNKPAWEVVYIRERSKLERNKITMCDKEYTPERMKAICNEMRSLLAAHKKFFPDL